MSKRPCGDCGRFVGPSAPWGPGNCKMCYLAATDPAYAGRFPGAWGAPGAPRPACRHLGRRVRLPYGSVKRALCGG